MPSNATTLANALADSPQAAALIERYRHSLALAEIIAPACAELGTGFDPRQPGCCVLRESELHLSARSSAQAAKLRHSIPRLLDLLGQRGSSVYGIKVRIQPTGSTYPESGANAEEAGTSAALAAGPAAAAAVGALADALDSSPLQQAVLRLQKTLQRSPRP